MMRPGPMLNLLELSTKCGSKTRSWTRQNLSVRGAGDQIGECDWHPIYHIYHTARDLARTPWATSNDAMIRRQSSSYSIPRSTHRQSSAHSIPRTSRRPSTSSLAPTPARRRRLSALSNAEQGHDEATTTVDDAIFEQIDEIKRYEVRR